MPIETESYKHAQGAIAQASTLPHLIAALQLLQAEAEKHKLLLDVDTCWDDGQFSIMVNDLDLQDRIDNDEEYPDQI